MIADSDGFIKYTLTDKEDVSSTSSIFTLKPASKSDIRTDDSELKHVVTSVQFKQPQLQIARSYTLLPTSKDQDPYELRFFIRREKNGEVSGYLHRLPLGSEVEIRGFTAEYLLPDKVNTVVFLAGGTGIAPAMQVAGALAGKADVHILWANRRRDDCIGGISDTSRSESSHHFGRQSLFGLLPSSPAISSSSPSQYKNAIVAQLDGLKQATAVDTLGYMKVDYFVDEEGSFIKSSDVSQMLRAAVHNKSGKNLLFVAGPGGFVNYWAGTKEWVNGQEVQGPLGGKLRTLDLRGWEVVKL